MAHTSYVKNNKKKAEQDDILENCKFFTFFMLFNKSAGITSSLVITATHAKSNKMNIKLTLGKNFF